MEIQGTDGSKTTLKPNTTTIFGRQNMSDSTTDLTVSRRHVAFDQSQTSQRVSFEVVGKNPVWVYSSSKNDGGVKKLMTFKSFQRGELCFGDLFCVSCKKPVWFGLKVVNDVGLGQSLDLDGQLSQSLEEGDFELDFVDGSNIDPVREFGFLVIGHEFDQYLKNRIHDIKNWNWFLDDPVGGSDDDDDDDESEETKGKKRGGRKRKKASGDDDVDEEWSADSEGEELTAKTTKVQRPKYHTRSKDTNISDNKRTKKKTSSKLSSKDEEVEEYEDEDEVDETLGGFIVDDETAEEEEAEGNEIDNDDEDEFVEDEDELEEPHNFCEDEDELDEQL